MTILLVEDEDAHAELIERSMERLGLDLRLVRARDGEEALELLELGARGEGALGELPKLVLLDLRLPKMSGHAVLTSIKESVNLRRVPVVVLTTSHAPSDVRAAYDRHVNGYLVKPPELSRLTSLLGEVAHYWNDVNTPSP